jgi:hypothetical protein
MSVDPEEAELHTMSTLTEEGVMAVKQVACDRLLASRVEMKLQVIFWPVLVALEDSIASRPLAPSGRA